MRPFAHGSSLRLLLGLRYRLIWAQVRSRQGRIALFVAGYCLVAVFIGILAVGGFGAAAASIRAGRAYPVAAVVLSVLLVNAVAAAVFLGIGVNAAFSEASLRRFPLSASSRMLVRHITALLEPLWLLVAAFTVSLAAGFAALGAGQLGFALPAAMLCVGITYLTACVVIRLGEWVVTRRGGTFAIVGCAMAAMLLIPSAPVLVRWIGEHPDMSWIRRLLTLVPSFTAARAMTTHAPSAALMGVALLTTWVCGLTILLALADRLPRKAASPGRPGIRWVHPVDRIASIFGSADAPLAGKVLRYYVRSPQVRLNFPLALPVVALMVVNSGDSAANRFLFTLGAAPVVAFLATGTLSMNLFGFDGPGFSRYFLLPLSAGRLLRTTAVAALIPGALLIPIGFATWWLLTPHVTMRMAVTLLAAAAGGLLFFHTLAIWTTVLAPKPIPFDLVFGNRLSVAANALFIGAMVSFFGLALVFRRIGLEAVLGAWWLAAVFAGVAATFFAMTVRAGARMLLIRRERILSELEGR